jgi:hypothetical protein
MSDTIANEPDPAWENCERLLDHGKTPELFSVLEAV